MTRILYGNWFSQGHNSLYDSITLSVGARRLNNINGNALVNSTQLVNWTRMANSGKFVGFIIHVGINDSTSGTTEYRIIASRQSTDWTTESIIGTVIIPAGEIGCFYSDPDRSEGLRRFFFHDGLAFATLKPSGDNSKGCSDVDFLLALDMDSASNEPEEGYD